MKIIKNKINLILIILFIVIMFLGIFIINKFSNKDIKKICIEDKKCFVVEIADAPEKRVSGLSNRTFLEENKGMLFIFEEEKIPGFWMKEMKFSIDIIWISKDKKIVGIEKSLGLCSENSCPAVYPKEKIKYVLEINSGLSDFYGFSDRDIVHIK